MRSFAVVLVLVSACAALRPKPDEKRGQWRQLTSEHFVVWTDTSPSRAQNLMRTMENLRQVVLGVSFFKTEAPGRSFVIAFHDLDELREYTPVQFIARAWSSDNLLRQPVIVLATSSLEDDRRIVTHELTHVISFNAIATQPSWFAEGLAGYFETVRLDEERATVELGAPLDSRMAELRDIGLMPMAALFACDQPACMDDRFYASTWALMTYLLNEHPAELMKYMELLTQTPEAEQAGLWATVFPGLPPSKLDHELASWLRYGRHTVMKYNIALRNWPVTEASVSEADVLAAKGVLRYFDAPEGPMSKEITQALALEPTNVLANMIASVANKSFTNETAHVVTSAHPDDWRAWWIAWRTSTTGAESREARDKTCSLLAQSSVSGSIPGCAAAAAEPPPQTGPDPRFQVFSAAIPQVSECMKKSKHIDPNFAIDLEISDSGAVTSAHASVGSPESNACVEAVVKALAFPAHHAGPYHLSTKH
jgi:hypothetical protein